MFNGYCLTQSEDKGREKHIESAKSYFLQSDVYPSSHSFFFCVQLSYALSYLDLYRNEGIFPNFLSSGSYARCSYRRGVDFYL